ncbi:MAG: hypothetical protein HXY40_10970 [Chloroflexi bacterium]|nr:hypothetical protein [Chloroflexota bacterium]
MCKVLLLALLLLAALAVPVFAQDAMVSSLTVADQFVLGDSITIPEIHLDQDGFIVIHIEQNGGPGPVAGFKYLEAGWYTDLAVQVDTTMLTPTVYPMLHYDTDANGQYEFAGGDLDAPVFVDGAVLVAPAALAVINATDQLVEGSFSAASVTIDQPGFLVIHIAQDGRPGPVLGTTYLEAGTSSDVRVEFTNTDISPTTVLFPMLHYDTDSNGVYEFAGGELDGIVVVGGQAAFGPIWTASHLRAHGQVVIYSDQMMGMMSEMGEMGEMGPMFHARSVLLDQPGFLVIHISSDGAPGPVAGVLYLEAGYHAHVDVPLDMMALDEVTTTVFPMLHYDTDNNGVYEFAGGELDGIVVVDGAPVFFPVNIAPSYSASPQAVSASNTLTFSEVVMDGPGFLVIHDDNNGAPGPVLGVVRLQSGVSFNVVVTLDMGTPSTTTVFPMLHYDTDANNLYEFAGGELDGIVVVRGAGVFGPLDISGQ